MLPERLKQLRIEANLTQKQMAETMNTSQPSYQNWEKGTRNPSKENLEKLANFFNVSTDYLLGKSNIKSPSVIDEDKLDQAINQSVGFNGKPATEEEKENMKEALLLYLKSLNDQS